MAPVTCGLRPPDNIIPASEIDPVSVKYLSFLPLPNRTPSNAFTQANNLIALAPAALHMNQYPIKIDQHFSDKDTMFFRYYFYQEFNNNGGGEIWSSPLWDYRYDYYTAHNFIINETHTFSSTLFNDFHLTLARNHLTTMGASYLSGITATLGLPSSVPDLEIPITSGAGLPANAATDVTNRGETTWQMTDNVTWVRGAHTLKMGYDVRIQQSNNFQPSSMSGTYTFASALTSNPQTPSGTGNGTATFMLGQVSSATINTFLGEVQEGYSVSPYIQDDYRIRPNLTLNLGLRYDYQPWGVERHDGLSTFLPNLVDSVNGLQGAVAYAGKGFTGSPLGGTRMNSFGPRGGFAWDLKGDNKTVFRAGYGIYYINVIQRDDFGNTAGFASTTTTYSRRREHQFSSFQMEPGLAQPANPAAWQCSRSGGFPRSGGQL